MKNEDVIRIFVESNTEAKTKHVFIEKNVLYSYGYHFPMALKLEDNTFIVNKDKYSMTTSNHQGKLRYALTGCNTIETSTEKLKGIIDRNIKNTAELTADLL